MRAVILLVGLVVLFIDDDEPEIAYGMNSAERAPTTTGASPAEIAAQLRARVRGVSSECHSSGRTPKRCAKRSRNWPVSAISGIRISVCLPRRTVSAIASK